MNDVTFSLDAGSIRSGFAVLNCSQQLIEAGIISAKRTAEPEFRINDMCRDLWALLDKHRPRMILLEWCSGKVNQRRHRGTGQGLQVHGAATGALWRECLAWRRSLQMEDQIQVAIHLITENTWTRGVPKVDRQAAIVDIFPEYQIKQDPGGDIADALGLAIWYLRRKIINLVEAIK